MAVYHYTAYNKAGQTEKGVLEGESPKTIRRLLRSQGLTPLALHFQAAAFSSKSHSGLLESHPQDKKIAINDLAIFTRELASLLAAGLELEPSLLAVSEQTDNLLFKSIIIAVHTRIREGYSLSASLNEFPKAYSAIFRATIQAGEGSGYLPELLLQLADYLENQHKMHQKIIQALVYPLIMTIVSISIVIFLLIFVTPKMVAVFEGQEQALPIPTQILMGISDCLAHYGAGLFGFIVLCLMTIKYYLQYPKYKKYYHTILLSIPLLNKTIKQINSARFLRALGILSKAKVPIIEAVKTAAELIGAVPMRQAVLEAKSKIQEGTSIHLALKQTGFFLPITLHFIANGENSGKLEEMLNRAADNQDRSVNMVINTLLTLFEPMLILLMGGIVLFIVLAILLPMFEMTKLIG